jgi:hypothetical protein
MFVGRDRCLFINLLLMQALSNFQVRMNHGTKPTHADLRAYSDHVSAIDNDNESIKEKCD